MAIWGSVAVGVGTIAAGAMNANASKKAAEKNAAANKDIAETPTRSTGIEDLLREVQSSTSESGMTSETQNLLEQLLNNEQFQEQFDKQQQQETESTINRGDAASQEALAGMVQGGDSQASVDAIVNQILREGKTGISNVGTRSGSFGSTTEQLLANDLTVKAAEAGALQQLQQDQLQLDAIKAAQAGTETQTGTQTGTETGTSSGESTSEQNRESTSEATSQTDKQTDTVSTDEQLNISDTFVNPNDDTKPEGLLADLVEKGLGMPTEEGSTVDGVGPEKPLIELGTGDNGTGEQLGLGNVGRPPATGGSGGSGGGSTTVPQQQKAIGNGGGMQFGMRDVLTAGTQSAGTPEMPAGKQAVGPTTPAAVAPTPITPIREKPSNRLGGGNVGGVGLGGEEDSDLNNIITTM